MIVIMRGVRKNHIAANKKKRSRRFHDVARLKRTAVGGRKGMVHACSQSVGMEWSGGGGWRGDGILAGVECQQMGDEMYPSRMGVEEDRPSDGAAAQVVPT